MANIKAAMFTKKIARKASVTRNLSADELRFKMKAEKDAAEAARLAALPLPMTTTIIQRGLAGKGQNDPLPDDIFDRVRE